MSIDTGEHYKESDLADATEEVCRTKHGGRELSDTGAGMEYVTLVPSTGHVDRLLPGHHQHA